ncbi:CRISPR-associated RAMP protein [Ktedonosporobacter rubrisoli]|uniref:CRISPR-associated RAMP protein n=1 Tax=Ktedonosporobacter rubrisoli TaxID=2509675 RepID=A0A4P6JUP0_KTERU|nr:CRISPR-associated RAMP protein Csx7 [Ktedonosporobacter rubrisoli]QBD78666.1 CRISPR-associated RAMP protein [Ktedonosporobacter rubrisoli]
MSEQQQENRYQLRNRYLFTGQLEMQTGLHIGGGKATLSSSNSPVVLTPEEVPYIPGSSFKGSLRSTVEKLVPGLPGALSSCGLIGIDEDELDAAEQQGLAVCSTVRQGRIAQRRRGKTLQEVEKILEEARKELCDTCRLFGSPFAASRVAINDLYMPAGIESEAIVQVRDGVAIDRDSEKARDRLKYDFEVVAASAIFQLEITLENAEPNDLLLLSLGLSEFVSGFGTIGGKRSRGLGVCLLKNLRVYEFDLEHCDEKERNRRLRNYLLNRDREKKFHTVVENGQDFIDQQLATLFKDQ